MQAIQMRISPDWKQMLDEAVRAGVKPDVILLPEMWNTGYALERK